MRTTLTIDDDLFDKAVRASGGDKSVSSVVTKALKLLISADSKKRILRLSGAMPDFTVPNRGSGEIDFRDHLGTEKVPMVAEDSPE